MDNRFIALLVENAFNSDSYDAQWNASGLRCCLHSGQLRVLVDQGTPTLPIGHRAALIGRLFDRSGTPVEHLSIDHSGAALHDHLLKNYWGEYVVVDIGHDEIINVLRDPSGGMRCIYFAGISCAFVTSSVSLANELGLFERTIDWDFIQHALLYPYARSRRTGLSSVNELLPGCSLKIEQHECTSSTAWSPWDFVDKSCRQDDLDEAAASVRDAIALVVKAWAELDRAVLLELSGGLDSSIVAACLHRSNTQVTCCTLVGPLPETDERPYARQVADWLGLELLAANLDIDQARFDFPPPADSVAPAMGILHHPVDAAVNRAARELDVSSLFSGAGGDSIFCYLRGATPAADAFGARGLTAGIKAVKDLSVMHQCPTTQAARLTLMKLIRGPKPACRANPALLHPSVTHQQLDAHPWHKSPTFGLIGDHERIAELAGTHSYRDGIARSSRWPMRYPLLSQPVMEACLRVPTWMWIAKGRDRSVARQAFADALPPSILHRRSKGSFGRYYASVLEKNRAPMHRFLRDGVLASRGLLDMDAIKREATEDQHHGRPMSTRLFDLCMVENWVRHQGALSRAGDVSGLAE